MKIEQIYTGCLSQGSYFIESDGEAAIIDPLREIEFYLAKAKESNVKIKYIFETHFHADFVSGHLSLSKASGAPIIFGPSAITSFESIIAKDGQLFKVGSTLIEVLHTPGHTLESTTYLIKNSTRKNHAIFSGDTLFLGDVGRPDLSQKTENFTKEDLAGILFDSLRNKIMPLEDDVIVYPAHGAGSSCGKNLSEETIGTLGDQKKTNYALRADMTKNEFIREVVYGLDAPPEYFQENVRLNKEGYADVSDIIKKAAKELTPTEFELALNNSNALILDVRHQDEFAKYHIPNSIFIGLNGSFAPWVGSVIKNIKQPILIVSPPEQEKETIIRLARVGFDNTLGYLKGGINSWINSNKKVEKINQIEAIDLKKLSELNDLMIFDVRKQNEHKTEHISNSLNIPLDFIYNHLDKFPKKNQFYIQF